MLDSAIRSKKSLNNYNLRITNFIREQITYNQMFASLKEFSEDDTVQYIVEIEGFPFKLDLFNKDYMHRLKKLL